MNAVPSSGLRVVVSGGSRGLGRAIVSQFLEDGCRVATFSRSRPDFIAKQEATHPDAFFWKQLDGTDTPGIARFVDEAAAHFDGVDVLINNAGVGTDGLLTLMSNVDIEQGLRLNLESAIHLTRACLKSMLRQQSGCILNISSVNGVRGHTGVAVYSAAKAGLDSLARSLTREVGPAGIRINSIAPGYFESDMAEGLSDDVRAKIARRTPLGRLGTTDDLVGVVRFMVSPAARFITGQTIVVDGGISC